ncbi:MAG TPA: hypothetical protein VG225_08735 [Terracidiphilus sp.]|nr:hypothetical protein [Terracidiphilus sp.]
MSPLRVRRLLPAALVPFLVAIPSLAFAQSAGQKAQPVTVDVVVTDSANRPVTNLGQQDFQVFEGGKKQTIDRFLAPEEQAQPEVRPMSPLPSNTFSNANAFPPRFIEIVLLDQMNTSLENQELALRALRDSLLHKPPSAAFAIFTLRSDDPACSPVSYAQTQFGIGSSSAAAISDWSCLNRGQLLMIQGITEDKERLLAALDDNLVRPRPTWMRSYPGSGRGGPPLYGLSAETGDDGFAPPEVYDTSTSALADLGEILRDLSGRKALIWISDSFDAEPVAQTFAGFFLDRFKNWEKTNPLSSTQLLHIAADRLALDRVALYPANLFAPDKHVEVKFACPIWVQDALDAMTALQNAGPTQITKQSMDSGCSRDYMKLGDLASYSGGKALSGASAVQNAITQAISDNSTHYVLVYFPKKTKYDSKMRKIRVELAGKDNQGDKLAYRRTYFADNPSSIYPAHPDEQHVYVLDPSAPLPFRGRVVRISYPKAGKQPDTASPLQASLRYGAPESNRIAFAIHVAPTGRFHTANAAKMQALQDNPSFTAERVQKAVDAVSKERQWQRKGTATLDALPPTDPISLEPYSIELSVAPGQLTPMPSHDGDYAVDFEIAVVAYDASGKRVTDLTTAVRTRVPAAGLSQVEDSEFGDLQEIQVPDRVTVLRFAVRDIATGRVGSLEVPVWRIASPYRRHRLPEPSLTEEDRLAGNQVHP